MATEQHRGYPPLDPLRRTLVTVSLALAVFMNILDVSIANVSIPTIAGYLAVSAENGTWIITSFAVSNAIAVPISGWLARRVGEVRLFVLCTLLFTLFSWICGLSVSFSMLLVARALQGAVAGPMIPLSQSLLLSNYPPEQHGFANGIWGMTAVVGPVAGPILGGWITDNINWSWIFYINVPIGLFAGWMTWMLLRERETATHRQPIDVVGLGLLIVGVACLQIMLDKGNNHGWFGSTQIVTLGLISLVTLSFFVVWELTDDHPVVDLTLFARRSFAVAALAMTMGYMMFFAGIVILPLWLQTQEGYTATWAGLATSSLGILGIVFSPVIGRLSDKVDPRLLVTVGFAVFAAVSFVNADASTAITFGQLFRPRLLWGIGTACFFIPLITLSLRGLHPSQLASASGLFNFVRLLSLGFGTSISVTLWDRWATQHDHYLTTHLTPYSPQTQHWLDLAHALGLGPLQSLDALARVVTRQAFMLATNDIFWLSGWVFLLLIGVIWLAGRPARYEG
ncbi:MAG: DHA2 family efflux MFS transporter permease subunit [Chromatiaceae bacterium]